MAWSFRPVEPLKIPATLEGMTWETWMRLPSAEKDRLRDNGGLTPQLVGLEGWRVEVIDCYSDEAGQPDARRFIVGKSTGWRPCHLELHNRRSHGGSPAASRYISVRKIEKVRG